MRNFLRGRIKEPGLPPGSIVFTGPKPTAPVEISIINYAEASFEEKKQVSAEDCVGLKNDDVVTWVDVNGVHDTSVIEAIGALSNLHPLIMEDIVHLDQRPKLEEYDSHLFVILKMLYFNEEKELETEQFSLVLGQSFVITFQEIQGDVLAPIRERLRSSKGRIRKVGADYLAYAIIDTIVDHYFDVIEQMGDHIESIEVRLLEDPDKDLLAEINGLKREVIMLRKSIWPVREVVNAMQRSESDLIDGKTTLFLRDVYDNTFQVVDMAETFRDLLSSLTDLYMSSLSQKMNEVMQFLTIIGSIFIPLTFIAGVYGMNFDRMPELHWTYGYPLVMGIMVLLGIGLLVYFKHKKWL